MIKNTLLIAALFASIGASAQSVPFKERAHNYVMQYKDLALEEQLRSGVPAAITLGQGILETEAGKSELATLANNHFGIKCKKSWTGESFKHDDDAPQECFRKYPSAVHSYRDHSDYLKTSKRYESCFAQDPTDYAAWARELRKCGYATNPRYAQILIKIIEDYKLQDYTYAALKSAPRPVLVASAASPVAAALMAEKAAAAEVVPEHDSPAADTEKPVYGQVVRKDGVRGFYARKGDVLLEYAIQYKVRYARLLEMNGLPDAPLAADMFVNLENGNRITKIIDRDDSSPTPATAYAAPATDAVLINEVLTNKAPALEASTATGSVAANPEPVKPARLEPAVENKPEPPVVVPDKPAPKEVAPVVAAAPAPVWKPTVPAKTENTINIADELAVEEQKEVAAKDPELEDDEDNDEKATPVVKAEEPKDEFSRLKAKLDKVVFAPAKKQAPATTAAIPAPAVIAQQPAVTAPAASIAAHSKTYHTVKSGETAFGIAKHYGITMKELMTMNNLNFEGLKIGQKLRVK